MGQTGVGKSSLINLIDENYQREIGEYSSALGRGKHQTKEVVLLPYLDGYIADTPGFSSLELNISKEDIKKYSKEFNVNCKYKSCMHINEEGCSVIPNLNKNRIYDERYKNYIKLIKEV